MPSPIQLISGATGPYTGQVGGYGRNAAFNVKQYMVPGNNTEGSSGSPFNLSMFWEIAKVFSGGVSGPEEILQKVQDVMKQHVLKTPELPGVQYTESPNLPNDTGYADVLAFSQETLKTPAAGAGPQGPGRPGLPSKEDLANQYKDIQEKGKALIGMIKTFVGPSDVLEQLEQHLNQDPNDLADQFLSGGFPNMFKDLLGGSKAKGLAKEVVDRNQDGEIDIAEKAAETLFLDDSVTLLKTAIREKLDDPASLAENFDAAMDYSTLDTTLNSESSNFDGVITVSDRKWALAAAENAKTTSLVTGILDKLLVTHDLRTKAEVFPTE